jgi:hypothetical protein
MPKIILLTGKSGEITGTHPETPSKKRPVAPRNNSFVGESLENKLILRLRRHSFDGMPTVVRN